MSKLETNTIDTVSGTTNLTIGSTNTSTITMPNGSLTGQNYPAFEANLSADTSLSLATFTKVEPDTEVFDTDNCYDNTTNYRFTPTVAGKYFVYAQVTCRSNNDDMVFGQSLIYKNGSQYARNIYVAGSSDVARNSRLCTAVIDINGSTDYLEMFTYVNAPTGTVQIEGSTIQQETYFGAYRIGA